MNRIMKWIARIYDLPNAYRVLDIMDRAECDIEQVDPEIGNLCLWRINCKCYVSMNEAEDLRRIVTYKRQYNKRNKLWSKLFFRGYRDGCRILKEW